MDFTREPIIETIITPKEGYKLVIRSSKSTGQEEYCVDAVEMIAFGHSLFFRSLERPKAFIVPASDYEVLEVREARMVLKNVGLDRSIKIGGGKEAHLKPSREEEKVESVTEDLPESDETQRSTDGQEDSRPEVRVDKKRDRRRNYRKRRGREDGVKESSDLTIVSPDSEKVEDPVSEPKIDVVSEVVPVAPMPLSSLLQPPSTLISETINRYRQNDLFKAAFYLTEEDQYKPHDKVQELLDDENEEDPPQLQEPDFDSATSEEAALIISEEGETQQLDHPLDRSEPINQLPKTFPEEADFNGVEEKDVELSLPIYAEEEDVSIQGDFFQPDHHLSDVDHTRPDSPVNQTEDGDESKKDGLEKM
ncbi:MAG: hypothetical protein ACH350_00690 [Parachlamydiaceae bacterium]